MVKLENGYEQVARNGAGLLSEADKKYPGKG